MNLPVFEKNGYVIEIEQNVLGALIIGGSPAEVFATLQDYHFVDLFHQAIYRAIKTAHHQYGSCGPVVIKKLLDERDVEYFEKASTIKVSAYLARLAATATAGASQSVSNAKLIIEQWARLSIAGEAGRLYAAANDPMSDVRVIAMEASKSFDDIMSEVRAGATRKTRSSISSAAGRAVGAAVEARSTGGGLTGTTWGLADLNRLTGGIQRRDLTLIGARPSMGKTTFALSIALKAARAGHAIGFVSLEMDGDKLAARALSDHLYDWNRKVPYTDIIRGNLTDDQIEDITTAQIDFSKLPIMVDEQSGQTMTDIRVRAERMVEDSISSGTPLAALIIDHLGLIRASSRYSGNRVNEIAEITSGMKSLARELDISVVLLSQLNRAVESRDNKRPVLSDLRDSGAIEQDADMIAFLYRESYYLERAEGGTQEEQFERQDKLDQCRNAMEFIIAKQRNGPLETVHLFADMAYSAVRNGARQ